MRKMTTYLGMAALAAGMLVTPVLADMHESDAKFSLHGEIRARGEYQSNLTDFIDHSATTGPFADDDFDLWPYRVRIGAYGQFSDNVRGVVEIQNASFFGNNPFGASQSSGDPFLQVTRLNIGTQETVLYQGYIEMTNIGDSIMSAKIGRQEHTLGNELMIGDLDFYNGTSFDGIRLTWDFEKLDLDGFYYKLQDGNVFSGVDVDADFWGVTAVIPIADNGQSITPYILNYRDNGTPILGPVFIGASAQVYTLGAQYGRPVMSTDDVDTLAFDWNIEAAFQSGEICGIGTSCIGAADFDLGGSIIEGWFGYNWNHGSDSRSRVHIGILMASGDDDPTDTDIDDFFPLFPDNHANNRLGDADMFGSLSTSGIPSGSAFSGVSAVTDISVGYEAWLKEGKHGFLAAIHMLTAAEDICFGGGGPTCAGGMLEDDLGMEIDVRYNYNYSANLSFEAGIANVLAGDAVDLAVGIPPGADDAMRVWGQARLRW